MRVSEIVRCETFLCADVRPADVSIILISEAAPAEYTVSSTLVAVYSP